MPAESFPPIVMARAAHALAFTDSLRHIGVPLGGWRRRYGLPDLDVIQPDWYVPVQPVLRFLGEIERREGLSDLGFHAVRQGCFQRLGNEFLQLSRSTPTLFARLHQFARLVPLENTHCRVSMLREGPDFRVSADMVGCADWEGLRHSEWVQVLVLVDLVRQSVAPTWQPAEITFQSRFQPTIEVFESFPNTRFRFAHACTSIKVPAALLMRGSSDPQETSAAPVPFATQPKLPATNLADTLKLVLHSYLRDGYPDVQLAAEIAGTSVRTLQRRLAEQGLNYAQLVLHARFEVASELLKEPDMRVAEVAYEVGYSDTSNFARAFRRVAGVSPEEYRLQLQRGI